MAFRSVPARVHADASENDAESGLLGETYLGESEVDSRAVSFLAGLLDSLREDARAAEVCLSSSLVSRPAI